MFAVEPIPDEVSYEKAAFAGLAGAGIIWTEVSNPQPDEVMVVMGMGLIGNLVLQAARKRNPAMLIGIDAIDARCQLAEDVGADVTINIRDHDPIERVRELTGGKGAHVVAECVGGPAGVKSFPQALSMTRKLGRVHLISLYQEQPLPLDSGAVQGKMVIGGYFLDLEDSDMWWNTEGMRRVATGERRSRRSSTRIRSSRIRHAKRTICCTIGSARRWASFSTGTSREGKRTDGEVYRVGIIGLGRISSTIDDEVKGHPRVALPYAHMACLREVPDVDVVAGADGYAEQRDAFSKKWGLDNLYADFREMLANEQLDYRHGRHFGETASRDRHGLRDASVKVIYAEKPIAISLAEADEMAAAAKSKGIVVGVGCTRRWDP